MKRTVIVSALVISTLAGCHVPQPQKSQLLGGSSLLRAYSRIEPRRLQWIDERGPTGLRYNLSRSYEYTDSTIANLELLDPEQPFDGDEYLRRLTAELATLAEEEGLTVERPGPSDAPGRFEFSAEDRTGTVELTLRRVSGDTVRITSWMHEKIPGPLGF